MNKLDFVRLGALVGAALFAGGCATTDGSDAELVGDSGADEALIVSQRERITALESELQASEQALRDLAADQPDSDNTMMAMVGGDALFPPNPKAGECYARVLIPASYTTESETVLVNEASERVEILPARYETVTETVLVKEASTRLEAVPAVYET
ncbi:MAG: hypothetical protein AAFX85_19565, partial [Pseudomonadota bacterium]